MCHMVRSGVAMLHRLHGSSQSVRIVDHPFLLLWVMYVDSIRICHALRGVPLRWRSSVPPRVCWCYLRTDRLRISLGILRSVRWTRVSGMGCSSFNTHDGSSSGRLFVGRLRTGQSIRLWRGCSSRLHRADMRTAPSLPSLG